MADTLKILAQSNPSATTLTGVYTASTGVVVSSLTVCNQSASAATFRVSVAISGAADIPAQYIYYDLPILGNDTFVATIGITLSALDVIRVYASSGSLSFNFFGSEVS